MRWISVKWCNVSPFSVLYTVRRSTLRRLGLMTDYWHNCWGPTLINTSGGSRDISNTDSCQQVCPIVLLQNRCQSELQR